MAEQKPLPRINIFPIPFSQALLAHPSQSFMRGEGAPNEMRYPDGVVILLAGRFTLTPQEPPNYPAPCFIRPSTPSLCVKFHKTSWFAVVIIKGPPRRPVSKDNIKSGAYTATIPPVEKEKIIPSESNYSDVGRLVRGGLCFVLCSTNMEHERVR